MTRCLEVNITRVIITAIIVTGVIITGVIITDVIIIIIAIIGTTAPIDMVTIASKALCRARS